MSAPRLLALALMALACGRSAPPPTVPLYSDLGAFHVPISSSRAQAYFDQGMRLTYAFNHAEAIRAFEQAAQLDPDCAICHWGAALAYGPNINWPMDSASGVAARAALERAQALADKASERERALIEALATRYASPPPANRAHLDSAYARAMGDVAARYPEDREMATLYAESLMDLQPWNYWEGPGKPRPGTEIALSQLEKVIGADSTHPGACHFYIHAVEAVDPARAVPCAERLAALMPGAGHLVHMPAHIYVRVGRYADAIEHNQHATHADSTFVATENPSLVYAGLYVPHNHHFLGFAALMAGRAETAIQASRATVAKVTPEGMKALPQYQPMYVFDQLTLLKFGRWQDVLASPVPASDLPVSRATSQYARGTAFAATGQWDSAQAALDAVTAAAGALDAGLPKLIVEIAQHSLAGEMAARRDRLGEAEKHLRLAMGIEDGLPYMEPPWWVEPVRHPLGAVLLRAGKARDAERVFQEDLARFPENCWSRYGLWRSLVARRSPQAGEAEAAFRSACGGAEVQVTSAHP